MRNLRLRYSPNRFICRGSDGVGPSSPDLLKLAPQEPPRRRGGGATEVCPSTGNTRSSQGAGLKIISFSRVEYNHGLGLKIIRV